MDIALAKLALPKSGAVALIAGDGGKLSAQGQALDSTLKGALARAIKAARFAGKPGQAVEILAPAGLSVDRVVVAGMGAPDKLDAVAARRLGGGLVQRLLKAGSAQLTILVDLPVGAVLRPAEAAAHIAFGAALRSYGFERYHTKTQADDKPSLKKVIVGVQDLAPAKRIHAALSAVAEGAFFTRDLVSEPANVLYPAEFAKRVAQRLTPLGVKVEILGPAAMKKLGMGAILGVAQGSAREPQLVVLQWSGGGDKKKPVAFVGKGVTFDTGGISLKPPAGMHEMKWDMGGAGAVAGLFLALAKRKAKVNAIGVLGLVENMPGGEAQRPGDVVTSMSGQTIEVLNTDAEGRLVLADAVWYTQSRFKPAAIVDLATLTGAIISALGHEMAGLFSDSDPLAEALVAAGKAEGELLWRFPLSEAYDKKINSQIADIANIGPAGQAGSILGAQFIKRFTGGIPWAHLDIAGVVWSNESSVLYPRGGTGYGVALLNRLVADKYES
jgi:leucyl aminopeptidase